MSYAVIFANGELTAHSLARRVAAQASLLIAADGGAMHCARLGLTPHVIIGDFDSLDEPTLNRLADLGAQIVRHPVRKDKTDLELAIDWAIERGATAIQILGALGGRWDQTLANLLLPALPHFEAVDIQLLDGNQSIRLLRGGGEIALPGHPGDTVSLIAVGGDATGINTRGLDYPLANGTLRFGSTIGISNVLTHSPAAVSLKSGMLICVVASHAQSVEASSLEA